MAEIRFDSKRSTRSMTDKQAEEYGKNLISDLRECNRKAQKSNRRWAIGAIIVLLLMSGWNQLHGSERIHANLQELKQARTEAINTVVPKSLAYCSKSQKKPSEEEVEKIIKKFEEQKYWLQLYRTEMEVSRGLIFTVFVFWHHDYTIVKNGKRVLCVPEGTK